MFKLIRLRDYNFRLVIYLILISIFGVLLVGSASPSLQSRQLMGVAAGFVIMVVISLIDYSWLLHFHWFIYLINIGLLVLVILAGSTKKGASRWIQIGGFAFQPTEVAKIMIIMFFAMFFMQNELKLNNFLTILKSVGLLAVPLLLIIRQPDLKNTITILIVFCILYYVAGLYYRTILKILAIIVPLVLIGIFLITQTDVELIDDYQKERIMTFMNPEDDDYSESRMQQENSIMAIGSGQLKGKGLNNNEVSSANKGNFVAEIQNDFIFAVAGEELGFIGCFAIIVILFLIVFECIITGIRAKDLSGKLISCGMASLIAVQSFINICVACGLLPNTGTTLPFVSYGLTSLLSMFIGMGLVLNVSLQRRMNYGEPVYGVKKRSVFKA